MTVKEAIALLSYGTDWQLVSARTGKILCNDRNKKKTQEKYMNSLVSDEPFKADFRVNRNIPFTQYITPMISIWVID